MYDVNSVLFLPHCDNGTLKIKYLISIWRSRGGDYEEYSCNAM
jgi:hypothetical protein